MDKDQINKQTVTRINTTKKVFPKRKSKQIQSQYIKTYRGIGELQKELEGI